MMDSFLRRTTKWGGKGRRPGERLRFWGTLRVLVYLTVVSFGFTVFSLRSVYGDVSESALAVGREMLKMQDVLGPPQPVVLNGTTMFVGGRHVDMSVKQVLDRFESYCGDNAGGFEDEFAKLPAKAKAKLPEYLRDARHFGTLRNEVDEEEGVLSCLVAPEGSRGFEGLIARAKAFMESGDVGKIGKLRYVFAKKNSKAGGSNIVTLWHEGSFNVQKMLFSDGDVPGRDTQDLPRPEAGVRVLSADVPGTGYGLRAFETPRSSSEVLRHYEETLPALGWSEQPLPSGDEGQLMGDGGSRAFIRNGAVVFVSAEGEGNRTLVTMAEMGTRGAVTARASVPWGAPVDETPAPPQVEKQ
jgi:hypothetical protein